MLHVDQEVINGTIVSLLEKMYKGTNMKHDAYYSEGVGVLFVQHGAQLHPNNILIAVSEEELIMSSMIGVTINVK